MEHRPGAEARKARGEEPALLPRGLPPGCYLAIPDRLPGRAAFSEVADRAMCVGAWWPLVDVLVALVGLGGAPPAGASAANTGPAMSMVARSEVTIPFMGLGTSCPFVHRDRPGRYATSVQTAFGRASAMPRRTSGEGEAGSPQGQEPLWHSVTGRGIQPRGRRRAAFLATLIGRVTWTRRARAPQPAPPPRPSWAGRSRSRSGASGTPWGAASGWRRTRRPPCDRARRTSASRSGS